MQFRLYCLSEGEKLPVITFKFFGTYNFQVDFKYIQNKTTQHSGGFIGT